MNFYTKLDNFFMRKDGKKDFCTCSPDVVFGVDIGEACKLHDLNIEQQLTANREEADITFREDINFLFKEKKKRFLGYFVSKIYYWGVCKFGVVKW